MERISIFLLTILIGISIFAQNDPKCNIGKSLNQMKIEFPELRYVTTDQKGDQYEDGYPQDGIGVFFYFNDGIVVEECMICQSEDGFPKEWFNSMANEFDTKYYSKIERQTLCTRIYGFSTFKINLLYISENGMNTAMIVYEKRAGKAMTSLPEPKTNLGLSLLQLKSKFPSLRKTDERFGLENYEAGAHSFSIKNGKVVCDSYTTYGISQMEKYINELSKTNFIRETDISRGNLGIDKTYFYKDYRIGLMLWKDDNMLIITYQHNDYFK